jgi:chromosome segregation ATPase
MRIESRNKKLAEMRRQIIIEQLGVMLGGNEMTKNEARENILQKYQADEDKINELTQRVDELESSLSTNKKENLTLQKTLEMERRKYQTAALTADKQLFEARERIKNLSNDNKQKQMLLITRDAVNQTNAITITELEDEKFKLQTTIQELQTSLQTQKQLSIKLQNDIEVNKLEYVRMKNEYQKSKESTAMLMYERDLAQKSSVSWRDQYAELQLKYVKVY